MHTQENMTRALESRALEIRTLLAMTLPCPYRQEHCTDCVHTTHCRTRENNCVFFKPNAPETVNGQTLVDNFLNVVLSRVIIVLICLFTHFRFPFGSHWEEKKNTHKHLRWAQKSVCANSVSTFKHDDAQKQAKMIHHNLTIDTM